MKPTVDIIGELLDDFTPKSKINNVTDNLDGTVTIDLCNALNLRDELKFTLNSIEYTVLSVLGNSVTYETGVLPISGDYVYPKKPFYFHGTPIATGNELSIIENNTEKLPMVYLLEIIRDEFINDVNSSIDRETTVRLFFLDEANFEDWDTDGHYSNAIIPQANYAIEFKDFLSQHKYIGKLEGNSSLTYRAKFGISITQNGTQKNLFSNHLSGVELELTIPIKKELGCSC